MTSPSVKAARLYHRRWSWLLNQVTIAPEYVKEQCDRQPLDNVRRLALPEFQEME